MTTYKLYRLFIYNKNEILFNPIQAAIETILRKHNCFVAHYDIELDIIECLFQNIEDRYETFKELQKNNIDCKLDPLTKFIEEKK